MPTHIRLTIAPDTGGGISYYIEAAKWLPDYECWDAADPVESGGWDGPGPRGFRWALTWRDYARRRLNLPAAVRKARKGWGDAEVKPYGYSPGGNAAPSGAVLTWIIP